MSEELIQPARRVPAVDGPAAGSRAAALAKALRVNERLVWVARAQGENPPPPHPHAKQGRISRASECSGWVLRCHSSTDGRSA